MGGSGGGGSGGGTLLVPHDVKKNKVIRNKVNEIIRKKIVKCLIGSPFGGLG